MKNQYIGRNCLKTGEGGLGQLADLKEGGLGEKEGVVFLRGLDTPMHTIDMLQAGFEPNLILRKKWHKTTLFHANNFISV